MSYNKINNIIGWIVGIIACVVYILTMEPSGSLWDCGEFVASCAKLQIPHPPGAPLFVLLGRLFVLPFGLQKAAFGVNLMSALSSGFTVLFLFWTITHYAKKLVSNPGDDLSINQKLVIFGAGVVGALAYCFSDTAWYSAVEGEVYALSSFFTAIVFWLACKWEQAVDNENLAGNTQRYTNADKYLIAIFYLMGLSIGVHLLNLLAIPAIVMIYYFKRYKATVSGGIIAFIIGCIITGLLQSIVVKKSMGIAMKFDVAFNEMGAPIFTGFALFWVFLAVLFFVLIYIANKNKQHLLKLSVWCLAFMYLGLTSYFSTLIRSNANVALDMYNVDNPVALEGYLAREQYGDWPIFMGNDFTTAVDAVPEGNMQYTIRNGKYEELGQSPKYNYASAEGAHIFPRMWQWQNDRGNGDMYRNFAGVEVHTNPENGFLASDDEITLGHNIKFFLNYQLNWMYFRYFMWNFAGKQNDNQGFGNKRDGNWITGIKPLDNLRLGDQSKLPESIGKQNKSHNKLYGIPFLLGIIGLVFQLTKKPKDFVSTFLLFFFTGIAIIIYLNQQGMQPRERDYAFVGSFYAYCIWIGLAVVAIHNFASKYINSKVAAIGGIALAGLGAPVLMANQEWDDHDRSKKVWAPDLAKNYLNSCPKNAVLVCFGDNDTYPLWFAQEVLGHRKDVRVINYSLLGAEWYVHQLFQHVNDSEPIKIPFTKEQMVTGSRDFVAVMAGNPQEPFDLLLSLKNITASDDPKNKINGQYNKIPSNYLTLKVNKENALKSGMVNDKDSVLNDIVIQIKSEGANRQGMAATLYKNDLVILSILAANDFNRPLCFTSTQEIEKIGILPYLRTRGMVFEFSPVKYTGINETEFLKSAETYSFGNANKPGVYFDEENKRHLAGMRQTIAQGAGYFNRIGKKEEAKKLLDIIDKGIEEKNYPYGYTSNRGNMTNVFSLELYKEAVACNHTTLAEKIKKSLLKDANEQLEYYYSQLSSENKERYKDKNKLLAESNYLVFEYNEQVRRYNEAISAAKANPALAQPNLKPPTAPADMPSELQEYVYDMAQLHKVFEGLK